MKLLMISTDRNLFVENSAVVNRILGLAQGCEQMFIIVFSLKKLHLSSKQLAPNVFLHPTNSISRLTYVLDAIRLGFGLIKNNSFSVNDFITCQDPFEVGLAGFFLQKIFKIKLELQLHTDLFSPYFPKHSFLNRVRVIIAKITLPKANVIRVVSQKIADSLQIRNISKARIVIRPIGVDLEKFKNPQTTFSLRQKFPQYKKIILVVSRLESEKNIAGAIKGFALLADKNRDFGLVIVGSGREKESLVELADKLKIAPQVAFMGWQDDLVSYYLGCDAVLVTSWYEGYGVVFKEAEACHCPIVSTDVGIAREVGAKIVGWKPQDIARGLSEILK